MYYDKYFVRLVLYEYSRIGLFCNKLVSSYEGTHPVNLLQVKTSSGCGGLWDNKRVCSHTYRSMLCARDGTQNRFLTHIRNV